MRLLRMQTIRRISRRDWRIIEDAGTRGSLTEQATSAPRRVHWPHARCLIPDWHLRLRRRRPGGPRRSPPAAAGRGHRLLRRQRALPIRDAHPRRYPGARGGGCPRATCPRGKGGGRRLQYGDERRHRPPARRLRRALCGDGAGAQAGSRADTFGPCGAAGNAGHGARREAGGTDRPLRRGS